MDQSHDYLGDWEGEKMETEEPKVAVVGRHDGNNNPVYETAKETLMYRSVLWTLWERERVGRFGRRALKHV